MFLNKPHFCTLRRGRSELLCWKTPKCNLERIADVNKEQVIGKQAKCSGKPSGVSAAKDLVLIDISKKNMLS